MGIPVFLSLIHISHLMAQMPVGLIGIPDGAMMAGNTGFKIKVHGVGGHGSRPDLAVDPIRPACDILLKVQAIPVNRHDPFSTVVVSPCMINAGTKNNIIPNDAEIEGNLRFFKAGEDIEVIDLMRKIAENVAAAYGCTAEVERVVMAPLPVVNDKEEMCIRDSNCVLTIYEYWTKGCCRIYLFIFAGKYGRINP